MDSWNIKGYTLEYMDDIHCYLVDGVIVPSITTLIKKDYNGVSDNVLKRAAEKGTYMHQVIQDYEEKGTENEIIELHNYKFLKKQYKWECLGNEIPIILFIDNKPVAAGRIDMHYKIEKHGLMDFKRTAVLDKEYVGKQLNIYRIGFQQCYDIPIEELKACHLRDNKRKIVEIPIKEELTLEMVKNALKEYYEKI